MTAATSIAMPFTAPSLLPSSPSMTDFAAFPRKLSSTTAWEGTILAQNPDQWVYNLTPEDKEELDTAVKYFQSLDLPLLNVEKSNFPLPTFQDRLANIRHHLLNEKGVYLIKGLDVHKYSREQQAIIFMGIGDYVGKRLCQNGKGHVLGHIKDLKPDLNQPNLRLYTTNVAQRYHTDYCDVVALLCLRKSVSGGESSVSSSHYIYNQMMRTRPDLLSVLLQPYYWERKGEIGAGESNYLKQPIIFQYKGKVITLYDRNWLAKSGSGAPPMTKIQLEAIDYLEELAARHAVHMVLEEGDMQFVHNLHLLHSRNGYIDHLTDPTRQRHLFRLWLSEIPEEGGWEVPGFRVNPVTGTRGGIRIPGVPDKVSLEAE
eukprot:TRINITY_DN17948_c0_g1_i1.p1 TRINITY_DN17948_c0_g1~~TRINITY_DN17948_c0_g1_i1.p1  ORF type:complete len:372 (-),score=71.66 TRINITY_DN17948_c0_g1_i1:72-1187(-)